MYERETGGTASVYAASEAAQTIVYKLRDGGVGDDERVALRLVERVGAECGLLDGLLSREWAVAICEEAVAQTRREHAMALSSGGKVLPPSCHPAPTAPTARAPSATT